MERLFEQEALSLQVPGGSWGTQQRVPRHSYCQGTARQSLGLPNARCRVPNSCSWPAGLVAHSIFFPYPSFPALLHNGMQKSKVCSCSVLTPSTYSPASCASYSPSGCVCVATTAARITTVRKQVSPQDCLLIPAGHVLVCVYSQQIPPTACSLAITKSSRAGRLCSLLHPSFLNPSSLPCSQGQFKGFHMCHLSSFSDSQLHCWEFGSPVLLQHMCRKVLPITGSGFSLFLGARGLSPGTLVAFLCHPPDCRVLHARQPMAIPCPHIQTSGISIYFHAWITCEERNSERRGFPMGA